MFVKQNYTWSKDNNYLDTEYFVNTLEKLKTYSKSINASGYSVTHTLDDVYNILKYQHAFWVRLTNIAPDTLIIENISLKKDFYYNLTKNLTDDQILNSTTLREYITKGWIKAANSLLFEQNGADEWFTYYEPELIETTVIDGTNATSGFVYTTTTTVVNLTGTNGTAYSHILIGSDYNSSAWKSTFQKSDTDYGYTVRNLFTSEKILNKLLKNFHLVDLASTENYDITISYPILNVDGVKAVNGHKILLMHQTNPAENGVYVYQNKFLVLDNIFKKVDDYNLFSVYVKEGNLNKEKQFFLDREEEGKYPLPEDNKIFFEANNYIVRNRISYRLLRDHSFNDAVYFTQNNPIINTDFTYNIYGTNGDYYKISNDNSSLEYHNGTNFTEYLPLNDNIKILNKIENIGNDIFVILNDDGIFKLSQFISGTSGTYYGTDGTGGIFVAGTNYFNNLYNLPDTILDFQLLTNTKGYFLSNSTSGTYINSLENGTSFSTPISVPLGTFDINYVKIGSDEFYFYLTPVYVAVKYNNKEYIIENVSNISKLVVNVVSNTINLNFLVNEQPKVLSIDYTKLINMMSWNKNSEYHLDFYSKEKIGQWEIINDNLYLKGSKVTNLNSGTDFTYTVPKISDGNYRTYDGLNDYSILSTQPINDVKSSSDGSFTVEFKVKPNGVRTNVPVFYLGEKSKTIKYNFFSFSFNIKLPVYGYMTFILRDTDGLPYFLISQSANKFLKIKANRILKSAGETISFTYQYTANKATGRLYFDGQLVGSVIDQRNSTTNNLPLDIKKIKFDQFLVGKSEFNYPYFKGDVSEIRLWNRDLNPAQVLARVNKTISNTDVIYSNLRGYWKMADTLALHKEEIFGNSDLNYNIFIGGLNLDSILRTITNPQQIQLSNDNLFIMENGTNGTNGIYRIDLNDEKTYKFYNTTDQIKSIYHEPTEKRLYFLEDNNIYKWDNNFTNKSTVYFGTNGVVDDFTVIYRDSNNQDLFLYKSDNNIYDSLDRLVYTSSFTTFKNIYGKKQTDLNTLNLYWKETDDTVHILSDEYTNYTSGYSVDYIASYPFISNQNVISGTNSYVITDNKVYKDSVLLDPNNIYWGLDLKKICGVYNRNGKLLILVLTNSNDVNVWQYDGNYIRLVDKNGNPTFFNTTSDTVDLTYSLVGNEEYLIILNPLDKSITWFKLQKGNKYSWTFVKWNLKWTSNTTPSEIDYLDSTTMWVLSQSGTQKYLSTITSNSSNHNLWENTLQYNSKTDGWIIGTTGLLFKDDLNSTAWKLEMNNLLYKDNFNDLEVHITNQLNIKGYVVPTWSGLAWMVGENGLAIRTKDNATNWEVLDTNINHNLNSVSFFNNEVGLIAGNNDSILATFTGGDSFSSIQLTDDIKNRDWIKVLHYSDNKALLLGNFGTIVHLTRVNTIWNIDKILNKLELTKLANPILDSDLDNSVQLNIKTSNDEDQYKQTLKDAKYLGVNKNGNDVFLIVGERDLIAHLELIPKLNYKQPNINYLNTQTGFDWEKITTYDDLESNKKIALLLNNNNIYEIEWDRWVQKETTNTHTVELSTFRNTEFKNLNGLLYFDNNIVISVGDRVNVNKHTLFKEVNSTSGVGDLSYFISDNTDESQDLKSLFQPKLLFLDYYLGRKINLHLQDGGFEIPSAEISKSLLHCYYFVDGEYIELTDFGTIKEQNNFLAFQDYYYLNRRVLDGGSNTFGKMESWNKYNKKIIAKSDYDSTCVWNGIYDVNGTNGFRLINEPVTDPSTYVSGLFEESMATKIQINPLSNFVFNVNDVLRATIVKTDTNVVLSEGDTLHFNIKTSDYIFNFDGTATVKDGRVSVVRPDGFEYFDTNIIQSDNTFMDVFALQTFIKEEILTAINLELVKQDKPTITSSELTVEAGLCIYNDNVIVREWNSTKKLITIWDLFNEDIIGDAEYGSKLYLKNLNYFSGNLLHLRDVFNNHLLSHGYKLTVNKENYLYVDGVVNDHTKYYNLETYAKLGIYTSGTSGSITVHTYPVKYSEDVVYGPQYDLLNFLNQINPIFDSTYEFDLPNHNFTYNSLVKTSLNEYKEFTISDNRIYVGEDLTDILDFKTGMFFDITRGSKKVNRTYLNKIEKVKYQNYDKSRYILYFDQELESNLQDSSATLNIRTRNKLSEISIDLEFTDNLMFPLPNGGTNGVTLFNRTYFNQTKTSSAYARYILNDDNIRKYVSAVVFLDDENDWNINIIDWQKDPNLIYRPVDLHELGIDDLFKKAISVEPRNLKVNSNRFVLDNIDLEKYNFRLVDGLTLRELERKYYWILNADIKNAIIGENEKGLVWYQGDWLAGIWEDGTWYSGKAFNIEWIKGEYYSFKINNNFNIIEVVSDSNPDNSVWFRGIWGSGNWYNGTWLNGTWNKGNRFNGIWKSGIWKSGTWHSGSFQGGTWNGGTWLNGTFSELSLPSVWNNGTWLGGDFENGVWKNGVWDQTVRVKSRFGTKATLLHKAVWEFGWWKNGEFHSGLTLNQKGETIASANIKNSFWYNGVWDKGIFYGGVWKFGRWNNGVWINGLWQSSLEVDTIKTRIGTGVEFKFKTPHYYKDGIVNQFTIIGEPNIVNGVINSDTEKLGYNTKPTKHEIVEIIDDYTVLIDLDIDGGVVFSTSGTAGTSGNSTSGCVDYTLEVIENILSEEVDITNLFYIDNNIRIVSSWADGTWNGGIWEMGYYGNGFWKGGIWLDGVHDNGIYGSD